MNVSIIIPLFNEDESLFELYEKMVNVLKTENLTYEIIYIDDGSQDDSLKYLKELHSKDNKVKIYSFQKNYGKSAALSQGFKKASGDIVITMDADLQDDPNEIPKLIEMINSGHDLVSGWKKKRNDPITKTIPSKLFNFITSKLTGIKIHDFNCGLKAYRKKVIKEIPVYGELHRYLPVLAHWRGYIVGELVVLHHKRKYGNTKFGARRFLSGFFDLFTVLFLTRYRQKPLHLFGFFGLLSFLAGFVISLYLTVLWFQGHGIGSRPLLFLGVLLIIVGMQSFSIGLIGEMITNTKDDDSIYSVKEVIE